MNSERWQQVERLYHSTTEKTPKERLAFLAEACAGDDELRREVESLLAYEDEAKHFIEAPALEAAAKMIVAGQPQPVAIGEELNQYKIVSKLGAGGMGEVYLAEDTRLKRRVALKFLPAVFTREKTHLRRFEVEARAIAALSHPNVCVIHEIIQTKDGRHCIVMEYVEGMTLRERIMKGPLKLNEALDIAVQITSALSSAHASGIVHRDIKPENVMLRRDGYVKVLDFGLAKLTETSSEPVSAEDPTRPIELNTSPGIVLGTVAYMSPEQARGLPVDARTDVWSIGVLLYEMVTGRKPFVGATPTDVIISIAERAPDPLAKSAPEAQVLQPIITKALAKNRTDRYQTAEATLIEIKNLKRELNGPDFDRVKATTSFPEREKTNLLAQTFTRTRIILLIALATIAGTTIIWAVKSRESSKPPTPVVTEVKSLAVLPMQNLSGDPSQDYFADGMTETLITGLARVTSLRVTSRSSVIQFKGSTKPIREIARELGVDAIVGGSVQRIENRILVNVELIHATTEQHLWTNSYDRDLRDVLSVQNEIARGITQAIRIKLTPQEQVRLGQARRIEPVAYDDFLRGQYFLNSQNKADNDSAIKAFSRAVLADPEFAAAWAQLAQAYVWKLFLFAPDEKNLQEEAFVAVGKAIALDPELPEAYLARGRLLWTPANHFPHDKAIQEYRRALALNPSLDEARNQLALVLGHVGLLDEALNELDQALAANPNNNLARFRVGETLLFQGKHEEALAALRNVPPQANPSLVGHQTVLALFDLGRKEEASATLERFLKEYPEDNRGLFTSLQAVLAASNGQPAIAEEKINLAIKRGKGFGHFHHTAYHIACAYALMNKPEDAIKWLESAANDGFPCYVLFETDHTLDSLRHHPRFVALMTKLKQQSEYYRSLLK